MKKIKKNYTNFILTVIAVGIIGINLHFFKNEIISPAYASTVEQVCVAGHRFVISSQGGIVQFKGVGTGTPVLCQN